VLARTRGGRQEYRSRWSIVDIFPGTRVKRVGRGARRSCHASTAASHAWHMHRCRYASSITHALHYMTSRLWTWRPSPRSNTTARPRHHPRQPQRTGWLEEDLIERGAKSHSNDLVVPGNTHPPPGILRPSTAPCPRASHCSGARSASPPPLPRGGSQASSNPTRIFSACNTSSTQFSRNSQEPKRTPYQKLKFKNGNMQHLFYSMHTLA
jgi:hypothetical protein